MPQPFENRKIKTHRSAIISPELIARERPELALAMLDVITSWASAEVDIALLVTSIIKGDVKSILEDLFNLKNGVRQRELLMQLAAKHSSAEYIDYLSAVLKMLLRSQRSRNRLVHHLSGISPQIPDGILLADPRYHLLSIADSRNNWAEFSSRDLRARTAAEDLEHIVKFCREKLVPKSKIAVYKMRDFDEMRQEMQVIKNCFTSLRLMASPIQRTRDLGLSQLRSLPQFQS